jgi:hypothetical protein
MGRLTDRSVKTVGEGRHGDGDGLQLIVSASGRRKWVLRYQLNGVRRDMGLGPYPAIGLSDARIAAADARKLIARGVDPLAKETFDNALDACEEAEVAPEIAIAVDPGAIIIQDNAGGIDAETIESILDYTVRVSSREAYVWPCWGLIPNS